MWYSKQHYAAELAKSHNVYFICPPKRWRFMDLFSWGLHLTESAEGVKLVDYRNNLPISILPRVIRHWAYQIQARKLKRLLAPVREENILWTFCPIPVVLAGALKTPSTKLIYHIVDPYERLEYDTSCAQAADLVVVVNSGFRDYYRKLNPNILLVRHGVRALDRKKDLARARGYEQKWGRYVVLAGALDWRLNYALLIDAFGRTPQLQLVLAGLLPPLEPHLEVARSSLLALSNVTHIGVLHPNELRNLVSAAEAGLIAYNFDLWGDRPTHPSGSLKALTYLAQLRPVISTIAVNIPELTGKGVFQVDDPEEFLSAITQAAAGLLVVQGERVRAYLDEHDYGNLVSKVLGHLEPDMAVPSQYSGGSIAKPA